MPELSKAPPPLRDHDHFYGPVFAGDHRYKLELGQGWKI